MAWSQDRSQGMGANALILQVDLRHNQVGVTSPVVLPPAKGRVATVGVPAGSTNGNERQGNSSAPVIGGATQVVPARRRLALQQHRSSSLQRNGVPIERRRSQ